MNTNMSVIELLKKEYESCNIHADRIKRALIEIEKILRLSFYSYQKFGEQYDKVPTNTLLSRYNSIVKKLTKFGN